MSYQDALQRGIYQLQDTMGDFLKCGNRLLVVRDRIAPYLEASNNAALVSNAQGLTATVNGMLKQLQDLQTKAIADMGAASDLKAKMDKDPSFMSVDGVLPDVSNLGSYAKALWNQKVLTIGSVGSDLASDGGKMLTFIDKVSDVEGAADDLDQLAQGKGMTARLQQLTGPLSSLTNYFGNLGEIVVVVGAIAGAIWLIGPSLVGRSASSAVRGAKKGIFS